MSDASRAAALDAQFRALLTEVAQGMPAEHREQASHYWEHAEWELAAGYFDYLDLTAQQRAELVWLVREANKRFEAMPGPWWKRMLRR